MLEIDFLMFGEWPCGRFVTLMVGDLLRSNTEGADVFHSWRHKLLNYKESFIADQRGVVAFETMIVYLFLGVSLFLPLADAAVAGLKFNSAYEALRNMGQRTQYDPPTDVTSSASITAWKSSLPGTIDGYSVTVNVYCGSGTLAPSSTCPPLAKYYTFTTSFSLSPLVLGSVLCSTCTVTYSQPFQ